MWPAEGHPLATTLELAVPLALWRLADRGGPSDDDWAQARDFAQVLAEHGDALLYQVTKGAYPTRRLFVGLVHTLAVLAYVPGGVTFAGRRWDGVGQNRRNV